MKAKILAFALLTLGTAATAAPFQGDIAEVIEEMYDFSQENNTFAIVKKQPLHIRLSPQVVKGDSPETVKSEVLRAATYGVYRTFIHTKEPQVQVTVWPMLTTIGPKGAVLSPTTHPKAEVTVSREKALEVAKRLLQVKSLNELVEDGDMWSEKMVNGRYFERKPGLQKLSDDLGVKYTP